MPIQTQTQRQTLVSAYTAAATHGAAYTTAPGASAGTEVTGGSPAYARKALAWSAPSASASTASPVFDIPSGTSVAGVGVHAGAAGAYLDGNSVPTQAFSSQGTYTATITYTQS